MKRISVLVLCFAFSLQLMGNTPVNEIDSLKKQLSVVNNPVKIKILNRLCYLLLDQNLQQEAEIYANQALDLSKESGDKEGLANSLNSQGLLCQSRFDATNAMKFYVSALKIWDGSKNKQGIATAKNNIGRVFYMQNDQRSALLNLNQALIIREQLNEKEETAETNKNLGDVYLNQKIYGSATEHYKRAMELWLETRNMEKAAYIAAFLGEIKRDMGDLEDAALFYNTSLDINQSLNEIAKTGKDYYNLANLSLIAGDYDRSLETNELSIKIRQNVKDYVSLAANYLLAGKIYLQLKDKAKSNEYLNMAANQLHDLGPINGAADIYKGLSETYKTLNNTEKAYEYMQVFANLKDSLYTKDKASALLELTTKYESEFKVREQNRKIEQLQHDQKSEQTIRYILIILIALVTLFLLTLFNHYRTKQEDNRILREKNAEIEVQKTEILEQKKLIDLYNQELEQKNELLNERNVNLDYLNQQLVSEMAERESIEKSSFARDHFLATMSHEMRTPLNIIVGLTHMLLDNAPRDEQAEHLRNVQFSANNLIVLINDILDYSKIETGKLTLENRSFQPKSIFDELMYRYGKIEKGPRVELSYDSKIPLKLVGDPVRLNQILTNLVNFSKKTTPEGVIQIGVKQTESNEKNEVLLQIEIKDNGAGVSTDLLNEYLTKFARDSEDIYGGYENSGIGLAITKRLVELQNGKLEASSEIGKGTSFQLILPYSMQEKQRGRPSKKQTIQIQNLKGKSILVVEDNKLNQLVVVNTLQKYGIEVVSAANGLEALDAIHIRDFDLILMDIQMPKMDGYRATAEIRKLSSPLKSQVPIIALTASAYLSEKEKAELFGMTDHLGKPFSQEELINKIVQNLADTGASVTNPINAPSISPPDKQADGQHIGNPDSDT